MSNYSGKVSFQPAPAAGPTRGWDIATSLALYVLSGCAALIGGFYSFMHLAYLDTCPPPGCQTLAHAVMLDAAAGIVLLAIGLVWGAIRRARLRPAWPVALGTLILVILVWAGGFFGVTA